MTVHIIQGDCRNVLTTLEDESVDCCVTSPPYYGLRDYGVAGQMGLEGSPEAFIAGMVEVFREVRRVLRDDGTLWLNMGDSYSGSGRGGNPTVETSTLQGGQSSQVASMVKRTMIPSHRRDDALVPRSGIRNVGYKPKDLMGMPWALAFALRADGWYLCQDIIWSKPNPMPESVRDRCTKAHEYLFLLSKSERYYYDQGAIAERASSGWDPDNCKAPDGWDTGAGAHGTIHRNGRETGRSGNKARKPASERGVPVDTNGDTNGAVAGSVPWEGSTRNKRSVWTIATQPFKEAHFATFPPALVEPCILAGCPQGGIVLDPFGGSGTTALVADGLQRNAILIELNPEYAAIAQRRIHDDAPLLAEVVNV